ncbi:MAG: histidine kinase dimerization/phosphoacceptor domain -containing protein [Armatimonadota bacterium]|nr:GAF domain-containing protein [bacterium]
MSYLNLVARNNALSALNDIVVTLSSSGGMTNVLREALSKALSALGVKVGSLFVVDADGFARCKAAIGFGSRVGMKLENGLVCPAANLCVRSAEMVVIPEIGSDERIPENYRREAIENGVGGANIQVPLCSDGDVVAVLSLFELPNASLTSEQMEFVNLAASVLGSAVQNVKLRESERVRLLELEALAKEAHHRIKNNLQMVVGLLSIADTCCESASNTIQRCLRQIRAVSIVHDLLVPRAESTGIELQKCLTDVARHALHAVGRSEVIALVVEGIDAVVSADSATALGIIVNELVSNAVEHGLKDRHDGRICLRILQDEKSNTLVEVADDGVGLPPGYKLPQGTDCGLGLAGSLVVHGLGGRMEIGEVGTGTLIRIVF